MCAAPRSATSPPAFRFAAIPPPLAAPIGGAMGHTGAATAAGFLATLALTAPPRTPREPTTRALLGRLACRGSPTALRAPLALGAARGRGCAAPLGHTV